MKYQVGNKVKVTSGAFVGETGKITKVDDSKFPYQVNSESWNAEEHLELITPTLEDMQEGIELIRKGDRKENDEEMEVSYVLKAGLYAVTYDNDAVGLITAKKLKEMNFKIKDQVKTPLEIVTEFINGLGCISSERKKEIKEALEKLNDK